jgi:hypothetical protein
VPDGDGGIGIAILTDGNGRLCLRRGFFSHRFFGSGLFGSGFFRCTRGSGGSRGARRQRAEGSNGDAGPQEISAGKSLGIAVVHHWFLLVVKQLVK